MTSDEIVALIQNDMRTVNDVRVSRYITSLLITPPLRQLLSWDYGLPKDAFDGFLALDHPKSGTGIAYCEQGFGPAAPWGLISTRRDELPPSMGTSDGWFPRFLDAFFESKASTALNI